MICLLGITCINELENLTVHWMICMTLISECSLTSTRKFIGILLLYQYNLYCWCFIDPFAMAKGPSDAELEELIIKDAWFQRTMKFLKNTEVML